MTEDSAPEIDLEHPVDPDRAEAWVGYKLDDLSGSTAGRVEGVFIDAEDSSPTWLIIRTGLLGRRSAVPFEFAAPGVKRVWVPCSKALIRAAPEVDPAAGIKRERELALCRHYGMPEDAGRRARLEGLPDGVTSVLATPPR